MKWRTNFFRNCLVHDGEVKLSDFGLSRELSNRAKKYTMKDMKQRLPIRWLAPEVLSSGTYSKKSDVYSFGILLWEVCQIEDTLCGVLAAKFDDR
ncbi:hypothetical protein ANCCAN_26904 [Ancylostoma caninum]|uniref:Protein kinase domain-containing protein n=1 Tax=Ancylostoma caninum TaxID=29170 RepID=A0A368F5L9_ANCCA|nr:hypothetical protein ANCCAN_26904 [Ancylostoma caninum]